MTIFRTENDRSTEDRLALAQIVEIVTGGDMPLRFTAYDGSAAGPEDSPYGLHLASPKGATYIATAPGDLGMARAYISGDLQAKGVHPGNPYELLASLGDLHFERPPARILAQIARSLGTELLKPIAPPPQEHLPRWRRIAEGLRHSKSRDAEVIHHHYDVSNEFYEYVLGPSMTYTCAVFESENQSLEDAQENKYRLVFEKLRLKPGDRLLDIGCGWGGMVRYAARRGVKALGVTLSREQAEWAQKAIVEEGLSDLAEVRHSDYRDVPEEGFDAISSIGLTEHIGVANYPAYFRFLHGKLRVGGLLLNHCITRPTNNTRAKAGGFIDRYVFPDGELTGSGRIITEAQNIGFEVMHEENLREHYALTLKGWCEYLEKHWQACVAEVGEGTARLWGLYMAGSRLGFERNVVQLHQVLAVKLGDDKKPQTPLRPWWVA
ncbi:class I SAM-dependent methyltransferase [Rhodococcus pyridinivorans]|uniref:Cyclopropane-fatty-acyl-phospholipid synthase n=1 Tax=Rhodococcus pyridinivorans AK37 TaxID=1114960 RepID=H0JS36_9NOCA|nr:class I SAM-dependent methyltransferase [Rhodococcus pyridinivorans]EHK83276.1 cyclopropane-fatty-acyl-phospholipid synthase [Rhodococcus pyridinivorans AK37]MCD2142821.1 class I SAM-dependent methyltransferase [Rhodococcus pyridinivorans]